MTEKNEIDLDRTQETFDDIVHDLETSNIPKPRIYTLTRFPAVNATLIVFDKFCAIIEMSETTLEHKYVALGRTDGNRLSHGILELVDYRVLTSDFDFERGVKAFKSMIKQHDTKFISEMDDIDDMETIIAVIVDHWKFASEIEMTGGIH